MPFHCITVDSYVSFHSLHLHEVNLSTWSWKFVAYFSEVAHFKSFQGRVGSQWLNQSEWQGVSCWHCVCKVGCKPGRLSADTVSSPDTLISRPCLRHCLALRHSLVSRHCLRLCLVSRHCLRHSLVSRRCLVWRHCLRHSRLETSRYTVSDSVSSRDTVSDSVSSRDAVLSQDTVSDSVSSRDAVSDTPSSRDAVSCEDTVSSWDCILTVLFWSWSCHLL